MRKIPVSAALLVLAMSGLGATLTRGQAKQGLPAPTERRVIYPEKDRKSTRLNSSHSQISYAVFCLKKKKYWRYRDISWDATTTVIGTYYHHDDPIGSSGPPLRLFSYLLYDADDATYKTCCTLFFC